MMIGSVACDQKKFKQAQMQVAFSKVHLLGESNNKESDLKVRNMIGDILI